MKALNLGCGERYHPDWINIDFTSDSDLVIARDLSKGIPASDNSIDLIYHSHLLEHFSKDDVQQFLQDCFRVLRPQGVLRVVIPDLEQIARFYLTALEQAADGVPEWKDNYDWMLIELFDQTVRTQAGGTMATYLFNECIPNQDFVVKRIGAEAKKLIAFGELQRQEKTQSTCELRFSVLNILLKRFIKPVYRLVRYPNHRRERFLAAILGHEYETLQLGRFRQSGEIHQWMYDRFSLKRLLEQCGFTDIAQRTATESYIPNWSSFNLDTEPDGSIYKPDSLFMEAIKPPT